MDLIFGAPLWKLDSDSFDEKKITEEIFSVQRSDPNGIKVSNSGGYHSRFDFKSPLTDEYIRGRLESNEGLNFPHKVTGRWANINHKGDSNRPHNHGIMGLSGVLFVTEAPGLVLYNGSRECLLELNLPSSHIINGKSGEIVVFPSTILHWVEPSKSDDPRITVAFNIGVNI